MYELTQTLATLADKLYLEYIDRPVNLAQLVDPNDTGYTSLSKMEGDNSKAKPSLMIVGLLKEEIRTLDKSMPEIYEQIIRKANEYVSQVRPALLEGRRGLKQVSQQFRDGANPGSAWQRQF